MSTILQFAIFPTDKGSSVNSYVSKAIDAIKSSGVPYQLTSMSTIIETETLEEALAIVARAKKAIEPFADRVYLSINADIRQGECGRMEHKVQAIQQKIVDVNL
ncbi:thiamine-binding protein [uncultured Acetobacteroides sp.]|uniref:thiamine-binding protein n=1 Tax=uncultured Acetobacteroides sp. TaxID=1760811 RepID=UPI0029F48DDF|nr:thiamine-binding protein [uncultured Acetobacteroides sp.]